MLRRSLLEAAKLRSGFTGEAVSKIHPPCCWGVGQISRSFAQAEPQEEEEEVRDVESNPRVVSLADEILKLNMLEVHDLTSILRKKLGISESMGMGMPMMGMPMMGGGGGAAPAAGDEAAPAKEEKKEEEKTEFDVKLESFESTAKIKLIKEIRGVTELGLKEAKDLVEKAPIVVKAKLDKKSAEEVKQKLEKVGGKVVLE